jgi:hypothetical protein
MQVYEERRRQLNEWIEWNREAVIELGETLGHQPPELLLEDPAIGLSRLDDLTRHQDMTTISRESAVWIESRLHAFVALHLITKFEGQWLIDGDQNSSTFGRYLVSVRHPDAPSAVSVDVGDRVHKFLYRSPPHSLFSMIIDLEKWLADPGSRPAGSRT